MKKNTDLYLENKKQKEKELFKYYWDCTTRIRTILKGIKESEEKEIDADRLNEIVYLLDELWPIYNYALCFPYGPLKEVSTLIGELAESYGKKDCGDFMDYPFVKDDEKNAFIEIARETLKKLLAK
jgi:hypothetical protein